MGFIDWIIENYLEIISTLGFTIGIYILIKININIKSQKASVGDNSSSNIIVQMQNSTLNQENIKDFQEKVEESIFNFPKQIQKKSEGKKEIFHNIENGLRNNDSLYSLCTLSLRLAKNLNKKIWIKFFNNELKGYELTGKEEYEKGIGFKKIDNNLMHRSISAQIHFKFKNRPIETFDLKMFLSLPIENIENLSKGNSNDDLMMSAPPLNLMVETLKMDPTQKVPYIIKRSSIQNVLIDLKIKIRDFLDEVEGEI